MHRSLRSAAAQSARSNNPSTPEPSTVADTATSAPLPPKSPGRPRFRLRKRTASNLAAPTKHFLASVAAADVPIPSIEEPSVVDEDMIDSAYPSISGDIEQIDFYHSARQAWADRTFSPPKTPAPGVVPLLEPHQFPDWSLDSTLSSLESSPDYESSRPSTARSTQTSSSLFSRYSVASEELSQCASPESEYTDRFGSFLSAEDAHRASKPRTASLRTRKAPWTRSMSQHLWATYMMYLQDPKVTPFRIGKSGIPPHGVCLRVAREAKRSWRRSKPSAQPQRSRNTTPTAESLRPASQWPHTCAATRGHLRELCKTSTGSAARNNRYNANSPTPFGKTASRYRNRRSAPAKQQHSVFSASEMAMSLSMSTSESMQPHGPLARLGTLQHESSAATAPASLSTEPGPFLQGRAPLGSPFVVKSCGPSVSTTLEDPFGLTGAAARQNQTAGGRSFRSLGSPARLVQSRPSSQKRRQAVLEPRRRKRPSLSTDFWTDPSNQNHGGSLQGSHSFSEFCSTSARDRDTIFVPRTNIQKLFEAAPQPPPAGLAAALTGPITAEPARLGSPFVVASTSQSFPNRFSSPGRIEMSALRRPYATVQQGTAAESSSANNASLANRLAYIDDRLRSINRPDEEPRRSQSPQ